MSGISRTSTSVASQLGHLWRRILVGSPVPDWVRRAARWKIVLRKLVVGSPSTILFSMSLSSILARKLSLTVGYFHFTFELGISNVREALSLTISATRKGSTKRPPAGISPAKSSKAIRIGVTFTYPTRVAGKPSGRDDSCLDPSIAMTNFDIATLSCGGAYDFVYADQESFEKYKPASFRQSVDGFREYKEKKDRL